MNDLNPYAIFVGASFAVGFVARTVIGGYRKLSRKPTVIIEEVIEAEPIKEKIEPVDVSSMNPKNVEEKWQRSYPTPIQPRVGNPTPHHRPALDNQPAWEAYYQKSLAKVNEDAKKLREAQEADVKKQLKQIAKNHESGRVLGGAIPITKNPPVTIRILPPASNHEVFGSGQVLDPYSFKVTERYFYNAIVRGEENAGPKVLSVGPELHRKIVEAFTKPEDDDISDLAEGKDLKITWAVNPMTGVQVEKLPPSPASNPSQVKLWLSATSDLTKIGPQKTATHGVVCPGHADEQKPDYAQIRATGEEISKKKKLKVVSFSLETALCDDIKAEAKRQDTSASKIVSDILKDTLWQEETEEDWQEDEAGQRQYHFSKGEIVRITDPGATIHRPGILKNVEWQCSDKIKMTTCGTFGGPKPEKDDRGEIVGFIMQRDKKGKTVPYGEGVAIVHLRKGINFAISFSGLESVDNGVLKNVVSNLRVGDWVHWKTQAGHTSIRPSVVFKTRKKGHSNEVQLGYVQKDKITRFWIPVSKCYQLATPPEPFKQLVAQTLPESVLASKLKHL